MLRKNFFVGLQAFVLPSTGCITRDVTRGGRGDTISRAPNHYGRAESLPYAPKSPNNVASTFLSSTFASERP